MLAAELLRLEVQQHDHEEEEDQDGPGVDEDVHGRQEGRAQAQVGDGQRQEGEEHPDGPVHRIAPRDHEQSGGDGRHRRDGEDGVGLLQEGLRAVHA